MFYTPQGLVCTLIKSSFVRQYSKLLTIFHCHNSLVWKDRRWCLLLFLSGIENLALSRMKSHGRDTLLSPRVQQTGNVRVTFQQRDKREAPSDIRVFVFTININSISKVRSTFISNPQMQVLKHDLHDLSCLLIRVVLHSVKMLGRFE